MWSIRRGVDLLRAVPDSTQAPGPTLCLSCRLSHPPSQAPPQPNRNHHHQLHLAPLPTVLPELRLPPHMHLNDRCGLGLVAPELLEEGGTLDTQLDNMFRFFTAPFRADRRVVCCWTAVHHCCVQSRRLDLCVAEPVGCAVLCALQSCGGQELQPQLWPPALPCHALAQAQHLPCTCRPPDLVCEPNPNTWDTNAGHVKQVRAGLSVLGQL